MLHLTPAMLESAYELLRVTPPFRNWRLPEPDDVEFHVKAIRGLAGQHFCWDNLEATHVIQVTPSNTTLNHLLVTMAHEMCHMRQVRQSRRASHGPSFKRLAAQVCKRHGFALETF